MMLVTTFFRKVLKIDFGFKEPDFIDARSVLLNSKKIQLSKRLIGAHHTMRLQSKLFGRTVFIFRGLTDEEIDLFRRKGFKVQMFTKSVKGKEVVKKDYWKITA